MKNIYLTSSFSELKWINDKAIDIMISNVNLSRLINNPVYVNPSDVREMISNEVHS